MKPPIGQAKSAGNAIDLTDEFKSLSLDLLGMGLDIAGILDPTPTSDAASALLSLGRGDFLGAALSGVSIVPYVGDLAKFGKFPKYLKTLEKAIVVAQQSNKARELLKPAIQKLDKVLELLPRGNDKVKEMKALVDKFLKENNAAKLVGDVKPDISKQFKSASYTEGTRTVKEVSGRLGVPGQVKKHRNQYAQKQVAGKSGDHAGHLAGNRFGAPGGVENLSEQNHQQNSWGTFKNLENQWADDLVNGTGIEVKIRDFTKAGDDRPYKRIAEWWEIGNDGQRNYRSLTFVNSDSILRRQKLGIKVPQQATPATVHDIFTGQQIR